MNFSPHSAAWLHGPTLVAVSVAAMACAAAIMSLFGVTQRVYRGYWWWVAAMWLAPLGAALLAAHPLWQDAVVPGVLLVLAWPVLITAGLRRFYARDPQFASHSGDALAFLACFFVWLVCWTGALPETVRSLAYAGAALVLHLYVAWFLLRLFDVRRGVALGWLIGVMLLQAVLPMLRMAWLFNTGQTPEAAPLLAAYVVLPLLLTMLFTVFVCFVLTHERTVADLRETQRQLRVLADIDMLTQVPNRRRFEELTARIVGQSGAQSKAVLMLFDIDHFKRINDTFGHAAGDEALRVVASVTRETLRTRDVLGRIGGDEFMLLLPGASVDDALQIAERITRRLEAQRKSTRLPLSLSFGVVKFEPGEQIEAAQKRADQALYEAKRQGRKRAVPAELQGHHTVFGASRPLGLETQ